jgi:hypothetical protein
MSDRNLSNSGEGAEMKVLGGGDENGIMSGLVSRILAAMQLNVRGKSISIFSI